MIARKATTLGLVALFVLHQDFWWRNDPALVFGLLPVSLAYHIAWTLLVALAWFLVGKYCWPAAAPDENRPDPDGR